MPVSNLFLELYIYTFQPGTNPTLMVFNKTIVDMDTMTWCKWKKIILGFFD